MTPSLYPTLQFYAAVECYIGDMLGTSEQSAPPAPDAPPAPGAPGLQVPSEADEHPLWDARPLTVPEDSAVGGEQAAPPAVPKRPVRPDQVLKRSTFKKNYPDVTWEDFDEIKEKGSASRAPKIKRTRRRRKMPYIDDEASCSDDAAVSSDETESSLADFMVSD